MEKKNWFQIIFYLFFPLLGLVFWFVSAIGMPGVSDENSILYKTFGLFVGLGLIIPVLGIVALFCFIYNAKKVGKIIAISSFFIGLGSLAFLFLYYLFK
jgi:hypothetical protein